jgi:LysM repeat protein
MKKTSITARILAVLALAGALAAVFIVVSSETGGDDPARTPAAGQGRNADAQGGGGGQQNRPTQKKVYEVQEGDSLTLIAEQTGVEVETIEELNPDVDPQALIPGQKLKLR